MANPGSYRISRKANGEPENTAITQKNRPKGKRVIGLKVENLQHWWGETKRMRPKSGSSIDDTFRAVEDEINGILEKFNSEEISYSIGY